MTNAARNTKWESKMLVLAAMVCAATLQIGCSRLHISHDLNAGLASVQQAMTPNPTKSRSTTSNLTIVGHRGSGLLSPDNKTVIGNTRAALTNGIAAGADWIEIDIRESSDGHLVVFHDAKIDRKTTGTGRVEKLTLSQLRSVDIKVNPPEKISTVEEVFKEFANRDLRLILDIKSPGVRDKLLPLVAKYFSKDQIILFGTYEVLEAYRDGPYALGLTFVFRKSSNRLRVLCHHSLVVRRAEFLGCDYLVLPIIFANQSLVDAAKSNGLEVWTYSSEDEKDWQHSVDRGISGLIVDSVEPAVAFKKSRGLGRGRESR